MLLVHVRYLCPQSDPVPTVCCADATWCGVHVVASCSLHCVLLSLPAVDDAVLYNGVGGVGVRAFFNNTILMYWRRLPTRLRMSAEYEHYQLYYDNLECGYD